MDVTTRVRSYVERKVDKLDRYMPNIAEVKFDLAEERSTRMGNRMIAQVTLRHIRGTILRAEEQTSDIFAAIDAVIDKLYRQIERYKGKRKRRGDEQENFAEYETAVELAEVDFVPKTLIRRKQFSVVPMHEEEALEQMELLGHDFFVFVNAGTGNVNVAYQRKDGNFGLLEPDESR